MLKATQIELGLGGSGRKFPVGVHSKCKVVSVEKGDNFIDFNYESEDGDLYHNKRVWFPSVDKLYPRDGETVAQAFDRDVNERLAHIVKHLRIFLSPEEIEKFQAPDFESFAEKAALVLNDRVLSSKYVNLSLIYDSDGEYSTFGRYPNYIEEYVEGKEPTIGPSDWERKNRMTPKEEPKVDENDTQSGIV